jgi:hypothetical protein
MAAGDDKKMPSRNPALQQPSLREIHRHTKGGFSLLKLTMTLAVGMILAAIAATSVPFPDRQGVPAISGRLFHCLLPRTCRR